MWSIRVVKYKDELGEEIHALREVFYDIDGLPYAHGQAEAIGSLDELQDYVEWMSVALSHPVLNYPEDFTGDVNKWD